LLTETLLKTGVCYVGSFRFALCSLSNKFSVYPAVYRCVRIYWNLSSANCKGHMVLIEEEWKTTRMMNFASDSTVL